MTKREIFERLFEAIHQTSGLSSISSALYQLLEDIGADVSKLVK